MGLQMGLTKIKHHEDREVKTEKSSNPIMSNPEDCAKGIHVCASWRQEGRSIEKILGPGRHLIGNSNFAAIQVGSPGKSICAMLLVDRDGTYLKCTHEKPTLFVDGKRLKPGDQISIGDMIQLNIGRYLITIAIRGSNTPSNTNTPVTQKAFNAPTDIDQLRRRLSKALLDEMNLKNFTLESIDSPEIRESARLKLRKLVHDLNLPENFEISPRDLERQVFDEVMGLGPLEPLLNDESVTEIMVNRRDQIYIEKEGTLQTSDVYFSSEQALMNVIERIVSTVGRRIDQSSPIVDARLLDGSRVNAVIRPLAIKGPNLTIRRFSKTPISVNQLVKWDSLTSQMVGFLNQVVCDHKNIMISGGTGSGKTTLLNALTGFIPNGERVITVEDAAELQLQQDHVISLETRPPNLEGKGAITIRDLVKNTLRMRPDRIIVGECRSGEALDMLQAMNTGHDGSMTTAHANSPLDMLRRLETMVLMAGMELPLRAIREQIASALCVIVQQTRRKTGRRLVTDISWVRGLNSETGLYEVIELFSRDRNDRQVIHYEAIKTFCEKEDVDFSLGECGGESLQGSSEND